MNLTGFSYPAVNLAVYAPNQTGNCMVSYYGRSSVYIVDINHSFEVNLYNEKRACLKCFPPTDEVFLVDLGNDGLHRVVCNDDQSLFFIDSGEIVEKCSTSALKMYTLSNRAQKMSARGIPCEVVKVLDEHGNSIVDLSKILHQEIWFIVHQVGSDKLVVTLCKTKPIQNEKINKTLESQFTKEDLDMLYQEPEIMTSNALRAVAGHVAQDEMRICPFFNAKTGGCFKGNSCRLIHVAPLRDGTTRDRKESVHKIADQYVPRIGSLYKICITCIVSTEEFYAHIPELSAQTLSGSLEDFKKKMNSVNLIQQYQPYNGMPDLFELVIIRYNSTYYRGKVIDHDEERSLIYFLDYGSIEFIKQRDIFQWHSLYTIIPALVYRCFLSNVRLRNQHDDIGRQAFKRLVLNGRDLSAEIISYSEDLYVRLYDENGYDIGETLCANGVCMNGSKIIPISNRFPG